MKYLMLIVCWMLVGCMAEVEQPTGPEPVCEEEFLEDIAWQNEVYGDCTKYHVMSQVEDAVILLDIDAAEHEEGDRIIIGRNANVQHILIIATDTLEHKFDWEPGQGGRQMFVFTNGTWELVQPS